MNICLKCDHRDQYPDGNPCISCTSFEVIGRYFSCDPPPKPKREISGWEKTWSEWAAGVHA